MKELRPVADFPGYFVSRDGEVYSERRGALKKLRPGKHRSGYLCVNLCRDGEKVTRQVHRLVALAFVPNPDNKPLVCHRDGDPANNRAGNLYFGTQQENMSDMVRHGRSTRGERCPRAVLRADQVIAIREAYGAGGHTLKALAAKYGVNFTTIHGIVRNKTWQHIAA